MSDNDFIIKSGVLIRYIGEKSTVTIPDNISVINEKAFEFQNGVSQVILPSSVKEIGRRAFAECRNLKEVICNAPSIQNIDDETFFNCFKLEDFTIPYECKRVGVRAFGNCESLKAIKVGPYGVYRMELVDEEAFLNCVSLRENELFKVLDLKGGGTSYSIPHAIKKRAFYNCQSLILDKRTFSYRIPYTIEEYAFYGCKNIKELYFGFCVTIQEYAFANCTGLTHVEFGNGVKVMKAAFINCTQLSDVSYSDKVCKGGYSKVLAEKDSFKNTLVLKKHKELFENHKCLTCGGDTKKGLNGVLYLFSRKCIECDTFQQYEMDCVLSSDEEYIQPLRIKRNLCRYCGSNFQNSSTCRHCGRQKDY